jgi:hypothetical protein
MQNILGYTPLEAGVRFLPATLMIVIIAPLAGRLTDRIGAKLPIAAGLTLVTGALFWLTTVKADSTYSDFFGSFILMGVGMALVMSPMSTAAMNAVATAKAGVASGILSMSRMVGGSLGVAVTGAVFQGDVRSRLDQLLSSSSGLSAGQQEAMAQSLAGGQAAAPADSTHAQTHQIMTAAHDAFVGAFASSMKVATAFAAAGIVIALTLISSKKTKHVDTPAGAATPAAELATGEHAAV